METRLIELIEKQGFTIEEIACKLSHNGRTISCGNLVKKIKDGTIKFQDAQQIIDILGYKIAITKQHKD